MATMAQKLIRSAEAAKGAGMERVLTGLAVRGCGKVTSEKLAERFQSMDRLMLFAAAYCQLGRYPFALRWELAEAYAWECMPR